jgi:hypothetical protein
MNPFPFTVRVKAPVPAVAEAGDSELMVGAGLAGALMVKPALPEVPPPGAGLDTFTWAVPAAATSAAAMPASSCVPLTYVVVRFVPFQFTTDPLMNPFPFTVRVKAPVPAVAEAGDSELMVGAGLAGCQPWTVIVLPVAEIDAPVPSANASMAFPAEIVTEGPLVAAASVMVTCATTPPPIVVAFIPDARQINDPFAGLHMSVLLVVVSAVPATTLREATSPAA